MINFELADLAQVIDSLRDVSQQLSSIDRINNVSVAGKTRDSDMANKTDWLNGVAALLAHSKKLAAKFDFDSAITEQLSSLGTGMREKSIDLRASVLAARIDALIEGIKNNLASRKFMYLPQDQAVMWDNPQLFGKLPKAISLEATEVGNCFAAGRWTACVFHCMRVAEHGIRLVAKNLKPPIQLKNKGGIIPIEYADWGQVITAINNHITEARKLPRNPKQEDLLQRYSDLAATSEYMKDLWRNELAHARRQYIKPDAVGAIDRVRNFLEAVRRRPQ